MDKDFLEVLGTLEVPKVPKVLLDQHQQLKVPKVLLDQHRVVVHKELKVFLADKELKEDQEVVLMVHKVLQVHKVPKVVEGLQEMGVHKELKVQQGPHQIEDIKIILSNLKMLLIK